MTVTVCVPVVTLPAASVAVYVIVVVPTGKTLPAGTPVRTIVTAPELSVAVAVPSSASVTTIDVASRGDLAGDVRRHGQHRLLGVDDRDESAS